MAASRDLKVTLIGEDKTGRAFKSAQDNADGFGSKVKGVGGSLALAFGGAAVAGIGAAGLGLVASVRSASDLNETVNKTNVIFGKNAGVIKAWSDDAATSLGLSRSEAMEAASGFGNMFQQLGVGGDQATKMSQDVVKLSADLGSFNNLPTADVADRMSAAFRGEFDSLQALIPNINAARVEQEALTMTGKTSASALTAQEKATATLAIVQRDGAAAANDFAETSDGLANKQKILQAQFEDIKGTIGTALLPVFETLAGFLSDKLPTAFATIQGAFGPVVAAFRGGSDESGGAISRLKDIVGEVVEFVRNAFGDLKTIFEDVVTVATGLWSAFGEDIVRFITETFDNVQQVIGGALDIIKGVFDVFIGVFTGDWSRAWDGIKGIVGGAWDIIKGLFRQALDILRLAVEAFWTVIKTVFTTAFDGIKTLVGNGWDAIKTKTGEVFEAIKTKIGEAWTAIKTATSDAFTALVTFATALPGRIVTAIGDFGQKLYDFAKAAWERFDAAVDAVVVVIIAAAKALPGKILTGIGNLGQKLYDFAKAAWERFDAAVDAVVATVITTVKGIPAKVTGALGDLGGLLKSAGRELIEGLLDGITSKLRALREKMSEVASTIKDFLPGSPVKTGPLTSWNGGAAGSRLMDLLASGIDARPVRSALSGALSGLGDTVDLAGLRVGGAGFVQGRLAATADGAPVERVDRTDELIALLMEQNDLLRNMPREYQLGMRRG